MGDFTWSFDWEQGDHPSIPIALQAGRVAHFQRQKWNFSVGPFYPFTDSPSPQWGVRFGISLLLPEFGRKSDS